MASNHVKNIAIVGSSGNSGSYMTKSLLETGKFNITALTREGSNSQPPAGCKVIQINYDRPETLVSALQGQEALIITLGVMTAPGTQEKLIDAAGKAGVSWIMPNDWSPDLTDAAVRDDVPAFQEQPRIREYIETGGKSSYIALTNGFWYEWSTSIPLAFGFDFAKKEATFFDQGETKISVSTWPQVGRAVAAVFSLPIKSELGPSLEIYRNSNVYVNSFTISQKDIFDSILRVTDAKPDDWKIVKVPARERFAQAQKELQAGDRSAFAKVMYTRIFYDDGNGNFEAKGKLSNSELGLPSEDLDEATKVAVKRAAEWKPW